jgi:predicted NAD/FAD-dependent oxidoreductase
VATGSRVRITGSDEAGVRAAIGGDAATFDAAIVAVGPHQLAATLAGPLQADASVAAALSAVARFGYEPITTIYLAYRDAAFVLPAGLLRLDDAPGQWVFDRTDLVDPSRGERLLAVVISASGPHDAWPQPRLADAVHRQLARALALPQPAWTRVIAERRATYACTPGLAHPAARIGPRLFLAGDYVYPRFPATLEAAVRSGQAAATSLAGALAA